MLSHPLERGLLSKSSRRYRNHFSCCPPPPPELAPTSQRQLPKKVSLPPLPLQARASISR